MRLNRVGIYALLIIGAFLALFPLYWMLSTSLKLLPETRAYPPIFFPLPHWENYPQALTFQPFARYFAAIGSPSSEMNGPGARGPRPRRQSR